MPRILFQIKSYTYVYYINLKWITRLTSSALMVSNQFLLFHLHSHRSIDIQSRIKNFYQTTLIDKHSRTLTKCFSKTFILFNQSNFSLYQIDGIKIFQKKKIFKPLSNFYKQFFKNSHKIQISQVSNFYEPQNLEYSVLDFATPVFNHQWV